MSISLNDDIMRLNPKLKALKEFHGHIGPYVVVGYRMGCLAAEKLGRGKGLRCIAKTGLTPPLSCIVDGIQFSASCTLGKGNIKVENKNRVEAYFFKAEKKLKIKLRANLRKEIDRTMGIENEEKIALWISAMSAKKLFDYS